MASTFSPSFPKAGATVRPYAEAHTHGGTAPKPAVQKAAQRYLNRASGRMETAQQMQGYRAQPPPHQQARAQPQGRSQQNVNRTTTTTTRTATRGPVSFINQSPAEIEARARAITAAEVSGIRSAYAPQTQLLQGERASALGSHANTYAQLGASLSSLQGQQAGTAKTFENYAADALNKASTAAPGAAQTAERLGLKPGEALPQAAQQQQEAARTLLSGIAQAGQAGTTERQQNEANFLTNLQATAQLGNAEGARNIEGQYADRLAKVAAQEGAAVGKAAGGTANLTQRLFGEQEKDRIAAAGLNYKGQEVQNKTIQTQSKFASERNKEREGKIKLSQGAEKLRQSGQKIANEREYKAASLGEKQRMDSANIADKEGKLRELGRKNQISEAKAGPGGSKVSASQKAKYEKEMTTALNAFERGPTMPNGKGRDYQRIRNELTGGELVKVGGKEKYEKGTAVNPVILNAMEQVYKYHYVNAETKKALQALGLPYEGLSNLLLRGR